jgi:hypothetical protein
MKLQAYNRLVTTIFKNPNHWNFKTTIAPTQVAMQQGKDYCLFCAPMPGRQFNNGSYRFGLRIAAHEGDHSVKASENVKKSYPIYIDKKLLSYDKSNYRDL